MWLCWERMRHVLHCSSLIERCAVHPNPLSLCLQVTQSHPVEIFNGLLDRKYWRETSQIFIPNIFRNISNLLKGTFSEMMKCLMIWYFDMLITLWEVYSKFFIKSTTWTFVLKKCIGCNNDKKHPFTSPVPLDCSQWPDAPLMWCSDLDSDSRSFQWRRRGSTSHCCEPTHQDRPYNQRWLQTHMTTLISG